MTSNNWQQQLLATQLPRWDELPDIEIYMDQLMTLIERYTHALRIDAYQHKPVTPSMVNNYVKLKLIPAPVKKRYTRKHLARLIVITLLKQVFEIPSIKAGIEFQVGLSDSEAAYNYFCEQIEKTIDVFLTRPESVNIVNSLSDDFSPIQLACTTLIAKLITEKELLSRMTEHKKEGKYDE